jgi:surface protein
MERIFYNARQFNADLSKWDVALVTSMKEAFMLAHEFTSDLSKWNVSRVMDMEESKSAKEILDLHQSS